jgi:hypothetical protein
MRLNNTTEWAIIGALIVYIALTPGFQVVRDFLNSTIGKVLALSGIIYVWKYVSQPIAILLTISVVRCMGMREGMKNPRAHCPTGFTLSDDNICKDDKGNDGPPATICLEGQTWNASTGVCDGSSSSTTAGIEPNTLTRPTGEGVPRLPTGSETSPPPITTEGFQPNQKDNKYAPA